MAIKEKVEIPLGVDHSGLGRDLKTVEEKVAMALQRMDRAKRVQVKVETALSERKLSELRVIHQRLLDNFNKKLKMDVDVKSLDNAKRKVEEVEKLLKRYKSEPEPEDPAPKGSRVKDMFKTAGALYGAYAGVSAIKDAVNVYNDFDTKMRNVNTNISVSQQELNGYSQKILEMSVNMGKPASELADAMYQATSAGMGAAESIGFVETATKAATAGITDTTTAVDGITSVLNAYQMSAADAGRVSDIMFTTVRLGKTTFEQLSRQIADVAPVASAMGVKFEEVAGAIASLTKQGVPTEKATTQIRAAMLGMNQVLGDGWSKTMTLQEGFIKVREKAGGSDNKLKELMGTTEGMAAVLALTGKSAKMAASDLEEMRNSAGATEKAFAMQADSFQTKLNKMEASFNKLKISLVETFAPAVSWVMDNFSEGLDRLQGKLDDVQKAIDKNKNQSVQGYMEGFRADDAKNPEEAKKFRQSELERVQKQIETEQAKYNKLANKETLFGINIDHEEMNNLRITLAELRNYRSALQQYNSGSTVGATGSGTGSGTGTGKGKGKDPEKEKLNALKGYYAEVTFLDEGYFAYRIKEMNKEAEEYKKLLGDKFNQEAFFLEQRKKLNEDYNKWMQEKLNESGLGGAYQLNDKGELQGMRGTLGMNLPRSLQEQSGEMEKPELDVGDTTGILNDWLDQNQAMRGSFDSVVNGVTEGLMEMRIRTAENASQMEKIFANMANAVIQQFYSVIAKWAVMNVLSFAFGGPGVNLWKMFGAHDGGAFTGSRQGAVKLAGGGSLMVPNGYPNDTYGPVMVQSQELLKVYTPRQQMENMRDYSSFVNGIGRVETAIQILTSNITDQATRGGQSNYMQVDLNGKIKGRDIELANKKSAKVYKRVS